MLPIMKWIDLKNKNTDELKDLLVAKKAEWQNLRWQAQTRQLKQVHKVNAAKKDIARLKVLLAQRATEEENKNSDK